MSWIEDNGFDPYEQDYYDDDRESEWQAGIHYDRQGNEYKISEMTTTHLQNIIKFFKGLDTSPLQEEINKRKCLN
mgnify:CR=1 FL=1|jgi:hypothetical protein